MVTVSRSARVWSVVGLLAVAVMLSPPLAGQGLTVPPGPTATDPQVRLKWFGQHKAMAHTSPFKDFKWQFLGPTNISGRVTDVAVATPRGKSYTMFVGTATGGVWKTDNEGVTWVPVFDQDVTTAIGDVTIAPSNPGIIWVGTGEANIFRSSNAGAGVFKSADGGQTWRHMGLAGTLTIARIVIHPKQQGDIPYQTVFALSESPMRFGLLYAGTDDGRLHVTKDGGKTWVEITKGLQPKRWMSMAVASAFDEGTVYVAQNGKRDDDVTPYLWKSTDFGATWKSLVANIPIGPINVITEDPTDARLLYVGTDVGTYASVDGGVIWNVLGGNLPSTYVHDIVVHPRDKVIVAATHGRGMWVMDAVPVETYKK